MLRGIENTQAARRLAAAAAEKANAPPLLYTTLMLYAYDPTNPRDHMLFAAAALGVAGALRASEFLSAEPGRQLTMGQFAFYADAGASMRMQPADEAASDAGPVLCILTLRITKTNQHGDTTKVISAPQAVRALWRWCSFIGRSAGDPVFVSPIGKTLTASMLTGDLNRRHAAAGLGRIRYTGKSFRRGGASTLAVHGVAAEDIAAIGWAPGSDMWRLYADDPAVRMARAVAANSQMDAGAAAAIPAGKYWAHRRQQA